ncbi:hypothetical protein EUTSA_v10021764mg [Eutrema salsugineum]|uniref:Uncharacterized protein n=1 Tax=Eutrema salsugineum TaxID=72664 RepID=V4NT88_EUTSA|nr:uncharacterized protein LOC18024072 [Eutrema salsugineum]ESQ49931.1 hypothetical protein EUTSA_v10021764mg [Eutrema salsugineum]
MAKISLLLFVVALFASLHAYEAHRIGKFDEALEKDLRKAEAMIEEDLKAKKMSIQGLTTEVKTLSKSEKMLNQLGDDYRKDVNLAPYEKKLKKFSRIVNLKKAPEKKKKSVSIIQSILKDFGLNRGRE